MKVVGRLVERIFPLIIFLFLTTASFAAVQDSATSLSGKYLEILESGVDFFEPIYTESLTDAPDAGFYDIRQYKNWTHPRNETYHTLCIIPANGQVVLTYAVLLKYSDSLTFGKGNYPRDVLLDHLKKTIRWICLTSAYVDNPYDFLPEVRSDLAKGKQWHRKWGYRQDLIGYLSLGVALLWDDLDPETQDLFKQVATGTALRGRVPRTITSGGNGNHDQVKQDLSSTFAAAYLFPDLSDHDLYWEFIEGAGLDMVSTKKDFTSNVQLEAGVLKNLAKSVNLHSDYSSLHHNHPSVWYGIDLIFEGRSYIELIAAITEKPVPDTFAYQGNGFDGVYDYAVLLSTDNGVINHLRTPEYDSSYGAGLLAFCYGNKFKRDPKAFLLETAAADLLARHTAAVGEYDYHRGSWAKAAMAYLWNELDKKEGLGVRQGLYKSNYKGTFFLEGLTAFIHRSADAWVGFVWGSNEEAGGGGPGAQIVPSRSSGPLIYSRSDGLTGAVLMHRPLWLYAGLTSVILSFGLACYWFYRKNCSVPEILSLIVIAGCVSALFIAWIDFYHTLPVRIPKSVLPASVFPSLAIIASVVLFAFSIVDSNSFRSKLKVLLLALSLVPCSLLLMTRTPWSDIWGGDFVSEKPAVYLGIFVIAVCVSLFGERIVRVRKLLIFLSLLMFLGAMIGFYSDGTIYLRLVSIRNLPRVYSFLLWTSVFLLSGLSLYFWVLKKYHAIFIQLFIVAAFSAASVLALSFGRFDLPKVFDVNFECSDDGFSTAGRSSTSHSEIRQAFFSYDKSVVIAFLRGVGKRNGIATWSGMPVSFYQRNLFVEPELVDTEVGRVKMPLVKAKSDWWNIDDLLGAVFSSSEINFIESREQLGFNWARTESYLDRSLSLNMSPKKRFILREGEKFEQVAASFFSKTDKVQIRALSNSFKSLDDQLKADWMGRVAKTVNRANLIAVANLGSLHNTSDISLEEDGWAPVFLTGGTIQGHKMQFQLNLKPYETFRDSSFLELFVGGDDSGKVQKLNDRQYSFKPSLGDQTSFIVRWTGPEIAQAIFRSGNVKKIIPTKNLTSENGVAIVANAEGLLNLAFVDSEDTTPPFVMIEDPILLENGSLTVKVRANDHSGLSFVELFMDGEQLPTLVSAPYTWSIPAVGDAHSFRAVAVDNSPTMNERRSFMKTWFRTDH